MEEHDVLVELRTIKMLLAIDKRDEIEALASEFSEIQERILRHLDYYAWRSIPTADFAESLSAHPNTIRDHRVKLEERNLVEKRGDKSGAEYRLTGLLGCAELLGVVDFS